MNKNLNKGAFLIGQPIYQPVTEKFSILWDEFPTRGWAAVLPTNGNAGKSILRDLAKSIANKKETFLNRPLNVRYGRVLHLSTSKQQNIITSLYSPNIGGNKQPKVSKLACSGLSETINCIENLLIAYKTDAVIIDSLPEMFYIKPEDDVKLQKAIRLLQRLVSQYDTSIIFMHDYGKQRPGDLPISIKELKCEIRRASNQFADLGFKKRNYSLV